MKKILVMVVVLALVVAWGVTNLGTSTKTTKYWVKLGQGEYELFDVQEETIKGIFDKEVDVRTELRIDVNSLIQ